MNASSLKSSIIGKWFNQKDNSELYEFLKDGTVIVANGQESGAGNYKFLDANRIKVDVGGWFGSKVFAVSIKNGRLQLSEPTGKYSIYISEKISEEIKGFNSEARSTLLNLRTFLQAYVVDNNKLPDNIKLIKFAPPANITISYKKTSSDDCSLSATHVKSAQMFSTTCQSGGGPSDLSATYK